MRWVLVEATSRILPDLDLALGQWTIRTLRRRGIQVRLGTKLVSAEGGHIILDDGTELAAGTLVWTVGGTANPLASASDLPVDEACCVRVTERLSVTGVPDADAAGDSAAVRTSLSPARSADPTPSTPPGRPRRSPATSSPDCAASRRSPTATGTWARWPRSAAVRA